MTTPIPQPPGVPILGNIFDVDPSNTWVSLRKMADKYGPIFKINALGHQIVFICSASLLEEICDEKRFRKCVTGPIVEIRHAVNDCLFTAYENEPIWGIAHRIMAPLLSTASIQAKVTDMEDTTMQLAAKWKKSDPNYQFDITDELRRLNLQTAVKCLYGQDLQCLEGPEPPMILAMERATQEAVRRPTRPKLLNSLVFKGRFDADIKTMREFAAEVVKKRQSQPAIEGDMLHALLHGQDPETGKSLTESQIIDEVVTLLIGSVTAPNFLSFTFYYLLKNHDIIAKAREEIDAVLPVGTKLDHTHLSQLPYCEAILRESMRLCAPAPGFNIEPIPPPVTTGPVLLAGGKYEISATQPMIAILSAVNRDPELFPDPEAFRPERMMGDGYNKLPSGVKKGFGNGKRQCIGKMFAWQWAMVTFITILRNVDLQMANPKYELEMDGGFSVKPVGFTTKAVARDVQRFDSKSHEI